MSEGKSFHIHGTTFISSKSKSGNKQTIGGRGPKSLSRLQYPFNKQVLFNWNWTRLATGSVPVYCV